MQMELRKTLGYFSGLIVCKFVSIYSYIEYKSKSKSEDKSNIIFDLDETLIHTDKIKNYSQYNNINLLEPDCVGILERNIWIRPWVSYLFPILAKFNNIYIFTKATKPYADTILEHTQLDKYIIERKYRDDCKDTCKDIQKFCLEHSSSILVDDKITNKCSGQNFYHIPRFNSYTKNDIEFIKLFYHILWFNVKNDFNKKK